MCACLQDYISIGGWIACSNHGNAGNSNVGDEGAIADVRILDMRQNTVDTVNFKEARKRFSSARARDYCVVDVSFVPVYNTFIQKRGIVMDSPDEAARWLAPGAILRMAFFGAARPHAIGLRWERLYSDTDHVDPHCCQPFCQFLQVDVFSAFGGCIEGMHMFDGKSELYYANKWVPPIFPFMTVAVVLGGVRNVEVLFKLSEPLNGNTLYKLCDAGIRVHKKHGGRTEVRYGRPAANSVVYYDVSMSRGFGDVFLMLKEVMGIERCALHDGKYNNLSTAPLARVSPYELLYGGV